MAWAPDRDALRGRVAVVAGATRGAGRGIAAALGEAGATVVCTGRSSRTASMRSDYDRAETIEETADLVTSLGGTGIAAVVDHLDPDQVASLAEGIRSDHGHIDVLVNDIWGGELLKGGPADWNTPIWELDLDDGLRILRLAIDTHLITSHHLLPLLVDEPGGLVVEVTDGTAEHNESRYRISVFYDLAKIAVNRLAFSQGHELEPFGATAVALTPGWLRSEMMLETFGVTEENWQEARQPHFAAISESPRFVGRAIAALAVDPDVQRRNGGSFSSGGLAQEYGFTHVDVREAYEWEAGRISGARHIELERLASQAESIDRDRPVVFYCRLGARSGMAANAFRRAGYDARSLDGGISAWHEQGNPLEPDDGQVA